MLISYQILKLGSHDEKKRTSFGVRKKICKDTDDFMVHMLFLLIRIQFYRRNCLAVSIHTFLQIQVLLQKGTAVAEETFKCVLSTMTNLNTVLIASEPKPTFDKEKFLPLLTICIVVYQLHAFLQI